MQNFLDAITAKAEITHPTVSVSALIERHLPSKGTMPAVPRLAVSVDEAAAMLGIGRTSIYKAINQGTLRTQKLGRRRLISMASVIQLISEQ